MWRSANPAASREDAREGGFEFAAEARATSSASSFSVSLSGPFSSGRAAAPSHPAEGVGAGRRVAASGEVQGSECRTDRRAMLNPHPARPDAGQ